MIVTPHLGASTAEATDRAGFQAAEQVAAALTGGVVTSAVNVPAVAPEDLEALGPFLPLAIQLGRIAVGLADGLNSLHVEYLGRVAERDTRLLTVQVLKGVLSGHVEEDVNDVNAPSLAEERGIVITETNQPSARDFTDLVRVTVIGATEQRVVGTVLGRVNRPHLLEAWGSRFNVQLEEHLAIFRYRDQPGMLGRVGTELGERRREHHLRRRRPPSRGGRRGGDGGDRRLAGSGRRGGEPGFVRRIPRGPSGLAVRALVITKPGPPEVLEVEERPEPEPGPDQVKVRVRAAGINFADVMARQGLYPDAPKPPSVVGYEFAGELESGERVLGGCRFGGYAEYVVTDRANVMPLPDDWSFEEGAAHAGELRHRLRGAGALRQRARGRAGPAARRRRRGGHRRHADRQAARRRGLRHGVGLQARRDPRLRRRPPDRLPQRGLRQGGAPHRRRQAAARPGDGRGGRRQLRQELLAAAARRPPGLLRRLGGRPRARSAASCRR